MREHHFIRNKPLPLSNRIRMKKYLFEKLKKEHFLWSYDTQCEPSEVPDEIIIEKTLIHLDYIDFQYLFNIYPKSRIKKSVEI